MNEQLELPFEPQSSVHTYQATTTEGDEIVNTIDCDTYEDAVAALHDLRKAARAAGVTIVNQGVDTWSGFNSKDPNPTIRRGFIGWLK